MKTSKAFTTIVLVIVMVFVTAVVLVGGFYLGQKYIVMEKRSETGNQTSGKAQPEQKQETVKSSSETVSIDAAWNKYTNHTLGFSLKVPKQVMHTNGASCKWSTDKGDHSYRPVSAMVPVKIFEDGNNVYISTEYFYKMSGETKENYQTYYSKCDKVVNSAELMKPVDNYPNIGWKFLVRPVKNDAELEVFIKDHYGSGCSLGAKKASKQDGVFDVSIKGDGLDLDTTKCPLNYDTRLKYDPAKGKLISWDLGQAYTYWGEKDVYYDGEMVDSFKFE